MIQQFMKLTNLAHRGSQLLPNHNLSQLLRVRLNVQDDPAFNEDENAEKESDDGRLEAKLDIRDAEGT